MMASVRRYFLSGLLFWLPIWATIVVVMFLLGLLSGTLALLPERLQPYVLLGFGGHPGIGTIINILITVAIIIFTGMFVSNFVGRRLVGIWESIVARIPLVRPIYSGVKQVLDTLFTPGGQSFRKVLLVEWPRPGMWSIAFQTGDGTDEVARLLGEKDMVSIFIPTTPNPTSGFLMMLPKSQVIELEMSVEQALKFVISLGVVQPYHKGIG